MNDFADFMFNVPIFHLEVRDWNNKKKQLLEIASEYNLIKVNRYDTVKSNFHTQLNIESHNDKILKILKEEINIFCNYFKFNYCKISNSWFETADQKDYHGLHNHGPIGYSSICYIDYDEFNHTPTQFVGPFHDFINGSVLEYEPTVKEGSIVFFPSAIIHYTNPNTSEIKRNILSFNLDVKENESQRLR